ncbi:MAG: sulfotransferase family protein [Myxococcales bacterium]|nr:MAG: sulfotransferase family protein [Myxococcales bacterium]
MALEVIGAGFGRTGTLSLKAALEGLGYRKCHHMEAVATSSEQLAHWHAIALGGEPDWEQVFDGYRAACDWPSCAYWEPLLGKFPDAKVVLSVRDEDRWYHSVATTIYPLSSVVRRSFLRLIPRLRRYGEMVFGIVWDGTFAGRFEDRAAAIQVFRDHNARVIADVPSDRLLVFDPKDG